MLDLHLLPLDADVINGIPLPSKNMEDCWGWSIEKSVVLAFIICTVCSLTPEIEVKLG